MPTRLPIVAVYEILQGTACNLDGFSNRKWKVKSWFGAYAHISGNKTDANITMRNYSLEYHASGLPGKPCSTYIVLISWAASYCYITICHESDKYSLTK